MSADTRAPDEQLAHILSWINDMGTDAARRIMGHAVGHELPAAQMTQMVDAACELVRREYLHAGGDAGDAEPIVQSFRGAVIREGRRIAQGLSTEGGRA